MHYGGIHNTKIAFFLATNWGGGAERVVVTIANSLAERGLSVDLVLHQLDDGYRTHVSPKVHLEILNTSGAVSSIPSLVDYLRRKRPTAMLATLPHVNLAFLLAKKIARVSTRTIIREANTTSIAQKNAGGAQDFLVAHLVPTCYRWADSIIAVSQGVAEDLSQTISVSREKINVIYNPVRISALLTKAAEPVDHSWFLPGQPPVIIGVGRLTAQKDFATLLRAFAVTRRNVDVRLIILGEGSERKKIEALAKELDIERHILLPGYVSNPYAFMARAKIFVLSSIYEGLPNTLIEALALGISAISTDCKSGPREILAGGKYGELVPVGDYISMSKAILTSLIRINRYSLEEIRSHYDLDRVAQSYLDIMLEGN